MIFRWLLISFSRSLRDTFCRSLSRDLELLRLKGDLFRVFRFAFFRASSSAKTSGLKPRNIAFSSGLGFQRIDFELLLTLDENAGFVFF